MKAVVYVALLFTIASCSKSEAPTPSSVTTPASAAPAAAPQVFKDRPALRVQAKNFLAEYLINKVQADNQYKDRVVEIHGIVREIKADIDQTYVVVGTGEKYESPLVQCSVRDTKAAAALNKGDQVSVMGRVSGLTTETQVINVIIKDCSINNDMVWCEKTRIAMGEGTCAPGPAGAALKLTNIEVVPWCAATREDYYKMVAVAKSQTDPNNAIVYWDPSACTAIVTSDKPIPDAMKRKIRAALGAL